jgi:hypothetical protein
LAFAVVFGLAIFFFANFLGVAIAHPQGFMSSVSVRRSLGPSRDP